jgi:8-oxo-dGTP diphosphatase
MRSFSPHFVAVYVVLERNNSILLLKRQNTGYRDGQYTVPSGHKEAGETPSQAALRELFEETGVAVNEQQLQYMHTLYRFDPTGEKDYIDIFFRCTDFTGEAKNTEPHKCSAIEWFSYNNLPENLFDYIREVLNLCKRGQYFSEMIRS